MTDALSPPPQICALLRRCAPALLAAFLSAPALGALPGAPANVVLNGESASAKAGSGRIAASWNAPADNGGSAISGYKIRWKLGGDWLNENGAAGESASGNSHTIRELTTGAAYTVQVAAVNVEGAGEWSAEQTAAPATKPGKPGLNKLVRGRGRLTASWNAPEQTGGALLSGYRLRWKLKTGAMWSGENQNGIRFAPGVRTYTITGLPNQSHDVQVSAVNRVARGSWSEGRSGTPRPNNLPDYSTTPPPSLTFPAGGAIDPPHVLPDAGGDAPVRFAFAPPPGMRFDAATRELSGTPSAPGTTQATLTATDADGESAELQVRIVVTPALNPPQRVNINVSAAATRVTWQPPADSAGKFTHYRLRWRPASTPDAWANPGGADGREIAAATRALDIGATAGTAHEVQVAAASGGVRLSDWSRTPLHRYTAPQPPRVYTVGAAVNDPLPGYYAGAREVAYSFTRLHPRGAPPSLPGLTFVASANALVGSPTEALANHFFWHEASAGDESARDRIRFQILSGVTFGAAQITRRTFHVGVPIRAFRLPAARGASGLQYALTPALPPGLRFNPATRELSGTPEAPSGFQMFTYTATAPGGGRASLSFGMRVDSALSFTRPPPDAPFRLNAGENVSLPLASASSGVAPFAYSLDGALPAGLSVDTALRRIRGAPNAVAVKRALRWRARDSRGLVGVWPFEMEVTDGAYFASRVSDREYTVNDAVTLQLPAARGGSGNFRAEIHGLPDGLRFAGDIISGMPSSAGRGTVTYTATDETRGGKISLEFAINIVADDSEEFQVLTAPEDGIGGKILVLPFTIAELDEETRFVWSDTGGAGDARLGADFTVTPSAFTVNTIGDLQPDVFTVTTREPSDNFIEARVRRAEISAVATAGDTGAFKTTAFPLTIADIDADTAVLRITLLDAESGDAAATFAVNAERRVKLRAELVRPGRPLVVGSRSTGGDVEQLLTASQAIEISPQLPPEWGASSGAPQTLRLRGRRSSVESGEFALTPTAAGSFEMTATFTPHFGALQNGSVFAPAIEVTARALAVGDARVISESGGASQQMVEGEIAPGAGAAVSAVISADDAPGANSASPADFQLGREPLSAFPLTLSAGEQQGNKPFVISVPLRSDDRLMEGRESFKLRLRAPGALDARATITIDADGAARLAVRAPRTAPGAGAVFTGTLQLERAADTGIAVGAGGSLTYANENSPPQLLVFADADNDGVLAGEELRAQSGAWTVVDDAREHVFQLRGGALPAGLRAAQFLPAGGASARVPKLPVVALSRAEATLAEGAEFADAKLNVTITPPLPVSAGLLLSYMSDADAGAEVSGDYVPGNSPYPLPAETAEVALPDALVDDAVTESSEEYTVTISAPPGAGYVVDPERNSARITINDDDAAEVTFAGRDSEAPVADPGARPEFSAVIGNEVQVGANAELVFADEERKVQIIFSDASGDGFLQGDELRQDVIWFASRGDTGAPGYDARDFIWVAPLGDTGATTFNFQLQSGAPRGLSAEDFVIGDFSVQKRAGGGALQIRDAAASRAETESGAYSLSLGVSTDTHQAFGAEVFASFGGENTVKKKVAFTRDEDARIAKPVEFTAEDFAAIGIHDNSKLDAAREVVFTAQLDAETLKAGAAHITATHTLTIEDDEPRATQVRYRLVDSGGEPILTFRVGSPTLAFLSAELFQLQTAPDGERAEAPVTLGIPSLQLTPRLSPPGFNSAELGGVVPPPVRIRFGESSAVSAERLLITPSREGEIRFATAAMRPPVFPLENLATDAAQPARAGAPDRSAEVARARNIVLDMLGDDDALLEEGASGVVLGFRVEDVQGAEAALPADAALTYAISPGEIASLRADDDDLEDLPGKTSSFGSAVVTIKAGETRGEIPIPDIVDDEAEEGPEIFVVALTGVSAAADGSEIAGAAIPSARATARYAIARNDTPVEKLLRLEALSASEADGVATIALTRPVGAADDAAIRGLLRPRASATGGADAADYDAAGLAFTIPAGMPGAQVSLPLVDDAVIEGDEEFRLEVLITAPEDGSVVAPLRATRVTIKDDDRGEIALETDGLRASEGQVLTVRVTLSAAAKRDVRFTVTPVFGGGEGDASADDFLVPGPGNTSVTAGDADALTVSDSIAAGARAAEFGYLIAHDEDGEETLELRLSFTDASDGSTHDGGITIDPLGATVSVTLQPAAPILFDVDGSAAADATDGLLIARYLLGLRGAELTAGLESDLAQNTDAEKIAAKIAAAKAEGILDADNSGGVTAADGILIARYFLGVTGDALTSGQSAAAAEDVARRIEEQLPDN